MQSQLLLRGFPFCFYKWISSLRNWIRNWIILISLSLNFLSYLSPDTVDFFLYCRMIVVHCSNRTFPFLSIWVRVFMLLFSSSFTVENISPKTDSHALAPSQKMENFQHHYDFELDFKKNVIWNYGQVVSCWCFEIQLQ